MAKDLTVAAHRGDAKTLLAFNLPKSKIAQLAGFTVRCEPKGRKAFYLFNLLGFKNPAAHAQDKKEDPEASINAPFQKFRWLHVPGSNHQGLKPFFGPYKYTVTPRYFDAAGKMKPLDSSLSVSKTVEVAPLVVSGLKVGFTRGYTQSQAFVRHFGTGAKIVPKGKDPFFDTSKVAGKTAAGKEFSFQDAYAWLGFTAREHIFELLDDVAKNKDLQLDTFAYDLNEPDIAKLLLQIGKQGRLRLLLDDSKTHQAGSAEAKFATRYKNEAKDPKSFQRGHFSNLAHDKIFIVKKRVGTSNTFQPKLVLTGSTNFAVTGLYVNSNHVLVFTDKVVAAKYAELFESVWTAGASTKEFLKTPFSTDTFTFSSKLTPKTEITFAPHSKELAAAGLNAISDRVRLEQKQKGSVFFAVMDLGPTVTGTVVPTLRKIHKDDGVFSFGISDSSDGTELYAPGRQTGVFVTGKPGQASLPPPFDQVPGVSGHQVHHKFVVCGFRGKAPVVYCGSSNLALGGESKNGDNLLAIRDPDVVSAFVIEASGLVDHFQFLRRQALKKPAKPPADKQKAAKAAGIFLEPNGDWAKSYYDPKDLHNRDRELFG